MADSKDLQVFKKLAADIETEWSILGYEKSKFPDLAHRHLQTFNTIFNLNELEDCVLDLIEKNELPEQLYVYNDFGQPPVTLFNNGKFVVDLYFWQHVDTSLHSHAFCGAFKVMHGRSLQESFKITKDDKLENVASDVMLGQVELAEISLLKTGDTQKILAGLEFNHRVIHLDKPTVTLCVRTVADRTIPQWHHFTNGLSLQKLDSVELYIKELLFFDYLFNKASDKAPELAQQIVSRWSISALMNFYEQLSMDTMGMSVEAVEYIFELIYKKFEGEEWFSRYQQYYASLDSHIQMEEYSPAAVIMEHAINSSYEYDLTKSLVELVQDHELNELQLIQLACLKK